MCVCAPQALAGYLREADRGGLVEEEYPYTHGRYRCWLQLGVTHFLVPQASLAGHVSGIAAGLLLVYAPQACECGRARRAHVHVHAHSPGGHAARRCAGLWVVRRSRNEPRCVLCAPSEPAQTQLSASTCELPLPMACVKRACPLLSARAGAALWRRLTGRQPPMRLRAGSLVRHRTRWWKDLLGHLVIGAGTVGVIVMRRGQASGAAR